MNLRHVILALVAASLPALSFGDTSTSAFPLLNAQQHKADEVALSLLAEPEVKAARDTALERWKKLRADELTDGKATIEGAIDETVFITLRAVAANHPATPEIYWTVAPPYRDGKQSVPGSRFGGDSPDRIYRAVAADASYRYEIRGQRSAKPSLGEFSFEAFQLPLVIGQPKAVLWSKDIDIAADGSFVVTADATPPVAGAKTVRNHLYLPPGTATIFIRDTLTDWSVQQPNRLTIKRLDAGDGATRSHAALVKESANEIAGASEGVIRFIDAAWNDPANEIKPFVRPLDWGVPGGVVAVNRFSLKDGEALVVTLDPIGARYVGFQLTDPWLRSIDYWNHISSLSNEQAKPNADGTFTYILAPRDPGYFNWLDTGTLHDGIVVLRWEGHTRPPELDKAVRETRIVKLSELASVLPANAPRATATERQKQLTLRKTGFEARLAKQ